MAESDMPLNDFGWDVEVLWVLCVHSNAIHQLVLVGKLLVVKVLLQIHKVTGFYMAWLRYFEFRTCIRLQETA
jgi:hypothetical protein